MAKITLDPILGSYASVTALNLRFQQIEDEFNSDVLYRNNPVGEVNTMSQDLDMNGYSILNASDFSADALYLGKYTTAPTTDKAGTTLGVAHTGYIYFNSTSNDMWVWNGTAWGLIGTTQNSAASVTVADGGGYFVGGNAETVLQEVGAITSVLDSTLNGEGGSLVGAEDAGGYFTGTDMEAVTQELGLKNTRQGFHFNETITPTGVSNVYFGSIPAWANRITLHITGMTVTSANTPMYLQLCTADVVTQNGAAGSAMGVQNAGAVAVGNYPATAFTIVDMVHTSSQLNGKVVLEKQTGTNTWMMVGQLSNTIPRHFSTSGGGSASNIVDSLRLYNSVGTSLWAGLTRIDLYYEE